MLCFRLNALGNNCQYKSVLVCFHSSSLFNHEDEQILKVKTNPIGPISEMEKQRKYHINLYCHQFCSVIICNILLFLGTEKIKNAKSRKRKMISLEKEKW